MTSVLTDMLAAPRRSARHFGIAAIQGADGFGLVYLSLRDEFPSGEVKCREDCNAPCGLDPLTPFPWRPCTCEKEARSRQLSAGVARSYTTHSSRTRV